MILRSLLFIGLTFLCGCMDQNPLGLNTKELAGQYSLHQFEGGLYYVTKPGDDGGGGILEGTVLEIGWNNDIILAKRRANFRGDPDGWMVINIAKREVSGPISEEERRSNPQYSKIETVSPDVAWKR